MRARARQFPDSGAGTDGFTLLELMVVIVIIGIMTAMIIPEMRGTFEDALLRSTSRELVNVFDLANSRAVSLNQLQRVRVDPSTGRYSIERLVRDGARAPTFAPTRDLPGSEGKLDTRISLRLRESIQAAPQPGEQGPGLTPVAVPGESEIEDHDKIDFYPDGTADAREILLQDRQGFQLVLRVNPVTARIQIIDLGRKSPGSADEEGMAP